MLETPFFFLNDNYRLFGVLHKPEISDPVGGFVFCHPFAEEKLWTHRVLVSFARELAKLGYAVLRFDYMGHGDSDGDFEDSTVDTRLADINCAIDRLKTEVPSVGTAGLLGLRFGATLAAHVAEQRSDLEKLVLWEPVIDGERYMQEVLRTNLTTQLAVYGKVTVKREDLVNQMQSGMTVNIDGYELSNTLFEQASGINLLQKDIDFAGATLIVQCGKEGQPLRKDTTALSDKYKNIDIQQAAEEPFWREIKRYYGRAENLFGVTLNWIDNKS